MAHAERCPVCGGCGKISQPNEGTSTVPPSPLLCHGCSGRGWVTVEDSPRVYPEPFSPYYWPTYLPYPWQPYEIICTPTTISVGGQAVGMEPR